jgi:ribonuclease D
VGFTPAVIDREPALADFLPPLTRAPWVALDTEADSLHCYPEKLCLLQISIPEQDVLVDPLAGLTLAPLFHALATKTLILHGADYDLRLLHRTFGFVPETLFDTMLAARLLGFQSLSYDSLVAQLAGVRLEKGPQTANWARRPLTDRMVAYARNDSHYLKPVHDALVAGLEQKGRRAWHQETCARLIQESTRPRPADPDAVWRIKGAYALDPCGLAVLRRLWHWRDDEALRASKPPYFVVSHEILIEVSAAAARSRPVEALLPRHLSTHRRQGLLQAVQEALALPPSEWPMIRRPLGRRLTAAQRHRCEELRRRRDRQAQALGLDPSLIATRSTLVELAADSQAGQDQLMDWQRQLLAG